jgi:hypothetical protein
MTDDVRAPLEASLRARYGTAPEVLELIAAALVFRRRAEEAQARLDAEGLTVHGGKRSRFFAHPCLALERESRYGFQKTLEALDRETRRRKTGAPTKVERLPGAPVSARARKYLGAQKSA